MSSLDRPIDPIADPSVLSGNTFKPEVAEQDLSTPVGANNLFNGILSTDISEASLPVLAETGPIIEEATIPEVVSPDAVMLPTNEVVDLRLRMFPRRLWDTFTTIGHETNQKGRRLRQVAAAGSVAVSEGVWLTRSLAVVLPTVFEDIVRHGAENGWNGYETGSAAALAVGGTFWAVGNITGKGIHFGINRYPESTEKVVENHPAMVGAIARSLDGFPKQEDLEAKQPVKPEEGYDVGPYDSKKTRMGKILMAPARGLRTIFLFGTPPHIGIAKVEGHSDESVDRRRRATSYEGAGVLGGIAVGLTTLIVHDSLGMADKIMDTITNKKLLFGVQFGLIGFSATMNYLARRNEKQLAKQEAVNENAIEAIASTPALEA